MTKREVEEYIMSQIFPNASHEVTAQNVRNAFAPIVERVWTFLEGEIGDLSQLQTTDKQSVVNAINAVLSKLNHDITLTKQEIDNIGAKVGELENETEDIKDATNLFVDYGEKPEDIASDVLGETPIIRSGDNANVDSDGSRVVITSSYDADRWYAFPLPNKGDKMYLYSVEFEDATNITAVKLVASVTGSGSGFVVATFTKNGNKYIVEGTATKTSQKYLEITCNRYAKTINATVSIVEQGSETATKLRDGFIAERNLNLELKNKINSILELAEDVKKIKDDLQNLQTAFNESEFD